MSQRIIETEIDAVHFVETLKVMYVVDDLIEKFKFLSCIPTKIGSKLDDMHGDEINRLISEQKSYEILYGKLLTQKAELRGLVNKQKLQEVVSSINEVSQKLKDSTKNLCKALKENPDIIGNMFKIKDDKDNLIEQFLYLNDELKQGDTSNFVHYVNKEKQRLKILNELKQKEKEFIMKINEIRNASKIAEEEFAKEEEVNNSELKKYKKEQNELKNHTESVIKYEEKLIHGRESCENRLFDHELTNLRNTKQQLIDRKKTEAVVSQKIKEYHKSKMDEISKQIFNWDSQKQKEIDSIDTKIEQIKKEIEDDKQLMDDRRKEMEEEEKMERALQEKEDAIKRKQEELIRMQQIKEKAALYIQWKYANYKILKATKKGKKKRKKGKKGKKK